MRHDRIKKRMFGVVAALVAVVAVLPRRILVLRSAAQRRRSTARACEPKRDNSFMVHR